MKTCHRIGDTHDLEDDMTRPAYSLALASSSTILVMALGGCGGSTTTSTVPTATTFTAPAPTPTGDTTTVPTAPTTPVPGTEAGTPGTAIPEDWPVDVPLPQGLTVVSGIKTTTGAGPTWSASFKGQGDTAAIYRQLTRELRTYGFKSSGSFGGGPDGGVSSWTRGNMVVQITVADQGGEVVVNVTAIERTTG